MCMALDPLKPELQAVVSWQMVALSPTSALCLTAEPFV